MDLQRIITDLRQYNHFIERAILNLEAAATVNGKRRGRPPAWMRTIRSCDRHQSPDPKEGEGIQAGR